MADVGWMRVPSDLVLADQNNWKSLGANEYSAVRAQSASCGEGLARSS